jgi:hypothetical protein
MAATTNSTHTLLTQLTNNANFRAQYSRTPKQNQQAVNAQNMVTEFFLYMTVQQGPAVNALPWWQQQYPNDALGAILSNYILWLISYRAGSTLSFNHIKSKQMPLGYAEFGLRFPQLPAHHIPSYGIKKLMRTSPHLRNTMAFVDAVTGGKLFDKVSCNAMFLKDVERVCEACPPTPAGRRMAAFLHASLEIGARCFSYVLTMPSKAEQLADGTWKLTFPPVKQSSNDDLQPRFLSQRASAAMTNFMAVRHMMEWENPSTIFCFKSTEAADTEMYKYVERAGYPHCYFSTHSLRAGFASTIIANVILAGGTLDQGIAQAKALGGWSCISNVIDYYLDGIVYRAMTQVNNPAINDVNDFSFLELHPDLAWIPNYLVADPANGGNLVLPGPFRLNRLCNNDGETEEFRDMLDFVWNHVRNPALDHANIQLYGCVAFQCESVALRFFAMYPLGGILPPCWYQAVTHLQATHPGGNLRAVRRARGTFINVAIRSRIITQGGINQQQFDPIPASAMSYFQLLHPPLFYGAPAKPKIRKNCIQSSDLASLRRFALNRVNLRCELVVFVLGEERRLTEMTIAQCVLLKNDREPSQAAWDHAGTLP